MLVYEILTDQTSLHQHKSDLSDGIWCPDTGLYMWVIRPGQNMLDRLYVMPICRPPSPVMRVMCCMSVFGGLVSPLPYSRSNCRSKHQLLPSKMVAFRRARARDYCDSRDCANFNPDCSVTRNNSLGSQPTEGIADEWRYSIARIIKSA